MLGYGVHEGSAHSFSVSLWNSTQVFELSWVSIPPLLRPLGYWGLQDVFPLQQNLPNHFGEFRIHLQTFSYYYKPFLVSDLGDRGTDHLWFWLWKPVPFKGVGSRKRCKQTRKGPQQNCLLLETWITSLRKSCSFQGWGEQSMVCKLNWHLYRW